MTDILFKTDEFVFSYRVAGICVQDGLVLLQKPANDDGYAFPGGHVAFGETTVDTLKREFLEEIDARVEVGALRWVAEIFFPWGKRLCHQLCLYYDVTLVDTHTPRRGSFIAKEHMEGRDFDLMFHWVSLADLPSLLLYPEGAAKRLLHPSGGVEHFVYRE